MMVGCSREPVTGLLSGQPSVRATWSTSPSDGIGGTGLSNTVGPGSAASAEPMAPSPARTVKVPSRRRNESASDMMLDIHLVVIGIDDDGGLGDGE